MIFKRSFDLTYSGINLSDIFLVYSTMNALIAEGNAYGVWSMKVTNTMVVSGCRTSLLSIIIIRLKEGVGLPVATWYLCAKPAIARKAHSALKTFMQKVILKGFIPIS
jgi:hypothetical protein